MTSQVALQQSLGTFRHVLTFVGGLGVMYGLLSEQQLADILTASTALFIAVGGLILSLRDKKKRSEQTKAEDMAEARASMRTTYTAVKPTGPEL